MDTATVTPSSINATLTNTSLRNNTAIIQSLYEAFGHGDIAGILSQLDDNVSWDNSAVASSICPWNANFSGKANVINFFKVIDENLNFTLINPLTFIESGNHVAVLLHLESTLKKNGEALKNDSMHLWELNDLGLVTSYRQFNDTARELQAWNA